MRMLKEIVSTIVCFLLAMVKLVWVIMIIGVIGKVISGERGLIVLLVLMIAISVAWKVLSIGYGNRCPGCRKWFALKKTGKECVSTEQISVLTEVKNRNNNRDVIGTSEQYIPGTRNHYKIHYVCKNCGCKTYSTCTKDSKNI